MVAAAAHRQRSGSSSSGQCIGSNTAEGMAGATVATAVLPPRADAVEMKTPAATAMAGAQKIINNRLKSVTATATETVLALVSWLPVHQLPVCRLPVCRLPVHWLLCVGWPVRQLPLRRLPVCRLPVRMLPVIKTCGVNTKHRGKR